MERSYGDIVKVQTAEGIVEGTVVMHYRYNEKKQFAVKFDNCGIITTACFSRKTGLPYGNKSLKAKVI